MKKINVLGFLLSLLLLMYCTSAKNQFEKGNYEKAVSLAIKKLQKNPNNKKQQGILKAAYGYAQSVGEQKVVQYQQGQSLQKYDQLIAHYRGLQQLYTRLLSCPGCLAVVTPVDYQAPLKNALQDGARAYAAEGNALLAQNEKAAARDGYRAFLKANAYMPTTVSENQLAAALEQGTERIGITPIPVASQGLQLNSAFFQQQLVEALNALRYPFADFQPIQHFKTQSTPPDWIVELSFDDYVIGQTYVKETRETRVKDSVALGTVKDSLGNKQTVYGSVEADVRRFEKTIESGGVLNITVRSGRDNSVRLQRKFPGSYVWINDWLTYQGDKRALNKAELKQAKAKEEIPPPPQVLFRAFTQPLFDQTARQLRREFRDLK